MNFNTWAHLSISRTICAFGSSSSKRDGSFTILEDSLRTGPDFGMLEGTGGAGVIGVGVGAGVGSFGGFAAIGGAFAVVAESFGAPFPPVPVWVFDVGWTGYIRYNSTCPLLDEVTIRVPTRLKVPSELIPLP
mmetsp:Transcript_28087/g.39694  ORF Transcript_28087/g.39694 Transcript_28087/m.39694 type:complete len:133 (-) Transcript_28087:590-988(-)